ncbi:MAG: hypothetical protein EOM20_13565 [Spartobacteria bacterium]|nr:hypothetical protein [Spartobacteria bacterium]
MNIIKRWQMMSPIWRALLGAAGGALFGLAVYWFVGCRTGTCPLTGNPYISMVIWASMGALFAAKP